MKMIIAILNSDDASTVMHNLMKEGYQITKLSTTGGFLRAGNVTVLIGVEDDKLEHCLEIIGKYSKSRKQWQARSCRSRTCSTTLSRPPNT